MRNTIEIEHLGKTFGKKTVVQSLNFTVPQGSIFAFLGPNGAGKTTTIKMMMNIIEPTSGMARVLGVDSRCLGVRELQHIGYVSEDQEVLEGMTVGHFLNYCKKMYPAWDDAFCGDLVRQFDLPSKEKLKNLSRGVRMKTSLVSSLAYRPRLLVFDEPFTGLDPLVREEFLDGILKLTESEGWTIFISSHDINEVERLADRVGIVDHGDLKICEETDVLLQRFRKISVTLAQAPASVTALPQEWLFAQNKARVVEFVDSQYRPGLSEAKVKEIFSFVNEVSVSGMTLREIFLVLAKQYKISSLGTMDAARKGGIGL